MDNSTKKSFHINFTLLLFFILDKPQSMQMSHKNQSEQGRATHWHLGCIVLVIYLKTHPNSSTKKPFFITLPRKIWFSAETTISKSWIILHHHQWFDNDKKRESIHTGAVWKASVNATGYLFFFFVVNFVIHWNETDMGLHVFPIPIPPPTSLSTRSPWVFPVHQVRALVSWRGTNWWYLGMWPYLEIWSVRIQLVQWGYTG